jgi:hypothetical protein
MSEEQIINPACYNNAGVISMDRVERLLQETEKLTVEELRYLFKTCSASRSTAIFLTILFIPYKARPLRVYGVATTVNLDLIIAEEK